MIKNECMVSEITPLNCLFCSGEVETMSGGMKPEVFVKCRSCNAKGPSKISYYDAVESWNSGHPPMNSIVFPQMKGDIPEKVIELIRKNWSRWEHETSYDAAEAIYNGIKRILKGLPENKSVDKSMHL